MWTRLWTRPSAWGHPYTPKGVTTPGRSTAHTHKGTAVDLKAEQLDSATAARGSATSALKQRAPASRDHSCVPALPACSPLWRATFLIVHDLHHDPYLLALATRYRPGAWLQVLVSWSPFPSTDSLTVPRLSEGLCQWPSSSLSVGDASARTPSPLWWALNKCVNCTCGAGSSSLVSPANCGWTHCLSARCRGPVHYKELCCNKFMLALSSE
jgi:hypothetical protein